MENENAQTNVETTSSENATTNAASQNADATPPNPSPNSTGKGKLLPEIGMGILGGIAAYTLSSFIEMVLYFLMEMVLYFLMKDASSLSFFLLPLIGWPLAILFVAEGVRLGGKLSGGHTKRKGCYIGTAIGAVIGSIALVLHLTIPEDPVSFEITARGLAISCVNPVLILVGAIVGYRKDAK